MAKGLSTVLEKDIHASISDVHKLLWPPPAAPPSTSFNPSPAVASSPNSGKEPSDAAHTEVQEVSWR